MDDRTPIAQYALALAYAQGELRDAFALLLQFDATFAGVASKGQEVLLKQLRFAWWREQIDQPAARRAKGEPLLARLSAMEGTELGQGLQDSCLTLLEAWSALASGADEAIAAHAETFARQRADALFGAYARWMGVADADRDLAQAAGRNWALASIGLSSGQEATALPRSLKPLAILERQALADSLPSGARRGLAALRLSLYALTGR